MSSFSQAYVVPFGALQLASARIDDFVIDWNNEKEYL